MEALRGCGADVNYAELHAYSNFTFLEGASHPETLIARAAELELTAIALTDRDGLYGAVRFAGAARRAGIEAIIGSELTLEDGTSLVLLIEDARGYANLCELISTAQLRGSKGDARLRIEDLDGRSQGLVALSQSLEPARIDALRACFRDRCYLELQHHLAPADAERNRRLVRLAREMRVAYVATNGVVYADRADAPLADILACVKETITLEAARAQRRLRPNAEYHLKSAAAMRAVFSAYPEAIDATLTIAQRCRFRLERLTGQFPLFPVPDPSRGSGQAYTRQSYLRELVYRGAADRYGTPLASNVERQLEYELGIIAKMDLAGYFLIVWDIVQAADRLGVLCQGRGSAANSAVCYALGITAVDPVGMNLLFERFMSEERQEIPDIDIDFAHQDREQVIQYVYERYGRSNAAMAAEVISYRTRSALRDVAKALGFTIEQTEEIAREYDARESLEDAAAQFGERARRLDEFCRRIDGFPRHMGIHSGGMVITRDPLIRVAPIEWATMRDRTVIQWDKDDLQELGLIKIDLLGLGMLSLLREAFSIHKRCLREGGIPSPIERRRRCIRAVAKRRLEVLRHSQDAPFEARLWLAPQDDGRHCHPEEHRREAAMPRRTRGASSRAITLMHLPRLTTQPLALHTIPPDDRDTYAMISKADTIGVFQIESRAQQSMLPRMKPRCFYDIVMQVAIIRPGPIQGQMVHPFLRRRAGLEPVTYPHPKLKPVLERTMGVPLFQEQGMRMAIEAAGFTPGEADVLRRAMGHKRSHERMREIYPKLVEGMVANGIDRPAAEQLFHMLEGFADYGFPESHAASFALLAYASAYVKCHFPAVFAAAILNVQPMGFYSTEVLVNDARRHGVVVKPVEVNASEYWSHVERDGALRLGFHLVRGLGSAQKERLEAALAQGPFADLLAFAQRTRLEKEAIENLAVAGAFAPWFASRREAMWALRALDEREARGELGKLMEVEEPAVQFAPLAPKGETAFDLWSTGVTTKVQAVAHFRAQLDEQRVISAQRLEAMPNHLLCRVGGLVITRQRPGTAKGFVFLTLEDETGLVNVIVRPDVYERYRRVIRTSNMLVIEGVLQKEAGTIDLLARAAWPLEDGGVTDGVRSHNFH
ncbi:MAG TPA: PHP domain-containing protein [Candidatus Baltobacteraceae bacterium]|nr:PHP domain-containing protein [Candidatus Baltobacteraceae bacterium]